MTSLYAQLCGVGAALFSGYYPLIAKNDSQKPAAQSMAMLLNAGVAYLITTKVAELAKPRFEQFILRTTITSQAGQFALFVGSVGALFVVPKIIAEVKKNL